ncbi:glycerol kinase, partial [Phenoliferia sp. Uapishka_3]
MAAQSFVGSIDCGTTSSRFLIFNETGEVICSTSIEFDQHFPHPVETSIACVDQTVEKFERLGYKREQIATIGITNQRETTLVWSKSTGKPLYNAIVWPDTRNTSTVRNLEALAKEKDLEAEIRKKTGLPFSTYFAGVKLKWLLDNVPAVKKSHDEDDMFFGTVETWLLWSFTGGVQGGLLYTDVTNASRTMFMRYAVHRSPPDNFADPRLTFTTSLTTLDWDDELLGFFGVRRSCLAKIVSNCEIYGKIKSTGLAGTTISGLIGDQQSALVGQKCLTKGLAKNTYGTGSFMLYNTGKDVVHSTHGLLTTPAYLSGPNATPVFALEGSIAVAGSSVKWVRDNLGLITKAHEIGELASKVNSSGGVVFVTGFSGLFAPYWDDSATGMIVGITSYTTKHHIARATLEATCFQTRAILDAMALDSKSSLKLLKVDGGMTESDICMQLQADILGIDVERPDMRESTALGAALCAGSAIKLFKWDLTKPSSLEKVNTAGTVTFKPTEEVKEREKRYKLWNRAVERSKGWNEEGLEVSSDDKEQIKRGEE